MKGHTSLRSRERVLLYYYASRRWGFLTWVAGFSFTLFDWFFLSFSVYTLWFMRPLFNLCLLSIWTHRQTKQTYKKKWLTKGSQTVPQISTLPWWNRRTSPTGTNNHANKSFLFLFFFFRPSTCSSFSFPQLSNTTLQQVDSPVWFWTNIFSLCLSLARSCKETN